MADDDEIDVLGDFNLDSFLSKNDSNIYGSSSLVSQNMDILSDYTLAQQWLPSSHWDAAESFSVDLPPDDHPSVFDFETHREETLACTENLVSDDSGWTEKEKSLLARGIEIFGKSSLRLSQFIGSKTPVEVRHYLKHFYSDVQLTYAIGDGISDVNSLEEVVLSEDASDLLGETEIPASIEEVIDAVSTAKTTVKAAAGKHFIKDSSNRTQHSSSNVNAHYKNKTALVKRKLKEKTGKGAKFKGSFETDIEINMEGSTPDSGDDMQKTVAQIVTGKGLSVPMCDGEEVVKIIKEGTDGESDSDVEIDIEDEDMPKIRRPEAERKVLIEDSNENVKNILQNEFEADVREDTFNFSECNESTVKELTSLEEPKSEVVLDSDNILELEKVIHSDFFEGRAAKTPSRYLKIRNHIINVWLASKPNYVTKTSIRQGLKNCGDVNCIGRIHTFLEQIGAINFSCPQTSYIRPLSNMLQAPSKEKDRKVAKTTNSGFVQDVTTRPRIKKKFNNDGEGGCTLIHGEQGEIINTLVVNETPAIKRVCIKKPAVKLIYCRPFPEDNPQKYKVNIELSALILMDLHSHLSLTEVMGLVGGIWNQEKKTLIILHYEPCRNVASSTIHCDMCPISQAKAADSIHSRGLSILGWFHSHPTFAPEPSQQDLETQLSVQQWIGIDKPCIGIIMSPFSLQGALIASPYRCLVVRRKENFEDQFVPFKFKVDVVSEDVHVGNLVKNARKIVEFCQDRDCLNKAYFLDQNLTYLQKFISSVRMHLAKCGNINKMTCDQIIYGLVELTK